MKIPTEPIGSIPRPVKLIKAIAEAKSFEDPSLDPLYEEAIRDTIEPFELTGSPIITDGEQRKYHNFCTYSVHGLANTAPDGFKIPFSAGHVRRMPRLTATRETAFAKIRAQVEGSKLAEQVLGKR
jgi:5-methyltetrahydropteroyltriglutamate--homocysteine methyltransferase